MAPPAEALPLVRALGHASFTEWLASIPGVSYSEAAERLDGAVAPFMIALYQHEEMVEAGRREEAEADALVRYLADFRLGVREPTLVRVAAALSSWASVQGRELPAGVARWIFATGHYPEDARDPWVAEALERLRRPTSGNPLRELLLAHSGTEHALT